MEGEETGEGDGEREREREWSMLKQKKRGGVVF